MSQYSNTVENWGLGMLQLHVCTYGPPFSNLLEQNVQGRDTGINHGKTVRVVVLPALCNIDKNDNN